MTAVVPAPSTRKAPAPLGLNPLRMRYLIATLLTVIAAIAASMWSGAKYSAADANYFRMAHSDVPGVVTVHGGPGTYYIYVEAGTLTDVRVTDAVGVTIPVTMTEPRALPDYGGLRPKETAHFVVTPGPNVPGSWRVEATGSAVAFAVGERATFNWLGWDVWGIVALLVVNVGAGAAIILMPIIRLRRTRARG